MSCDNRTFDFTADQADTIKRCLDILDHAWEKEQHEPELSCLNAAIEGLYSVMTVYELWEDKQ